MADITDEGISCEKIIVNDNLQILWTPIIYMMWLQFTMPVEVGEALMNSYTFYDFGHLFNYVSAILM